MGVAFILSSFGLREGSVASIIGLQRKLRFGGLGGAPNQDLIDVEDLTSPPSKAPGISFLELKTGSGLN